MAKSTNPATATAPARRESQPDLAARPTIATSPSTMTANPMVWTNDEVVDWIALSCHSDLMLRLTPLTSWIQFTNALTTSPAAPISVRTRRAPMLAQLYPLVGVGAEYTGR